MLRRLLPLLVLAACRPSNEQTPIQAPIASASAVPAGSTAPLPPVSEGRRRSPSREIVKRWPFRDSPSVTLYGDFGGFFGTELARAIVKEMTAVAGKEATSAQAQCFAGLTTMREVAFGIEDHEGIIIARFDKDPTALVKNCLESLDADVRPEKVPGASTAWGTGSSGGERLVIAGNFAIFGDPPIVERSLAVDAPDEGSLASIQLAEGQFGSWQAHSSGNDMRGTVVANQDHVFADGLLTFTEQEQAERAERELNGARIARVLGRAIEEVDKKGAWTVVNRLARAVTVQREERRVSVAFEIKGTPAEQATDLGAMGAIGVRAAMVVVKEQRTREARNMLWTISSDITNTWAALDRAAAVKKKLTSLPAVPKAVPKGVKVKTTDADWKAWSVIHFKNENPQRFQYEVKAAKDGESAEIIARGDLDGTGKQSVLTLTVRIDRASNTAISDGNIDEK